MPRDTRHMTPDTLPRIGITAKKQRQGVLRRLGAQLLVGRHLGRRPAGAADAGDGHAAARPAGRRNWTVCCSPAAATFTRSTTRSASTAQRSTTSTTAAIRLELGLAARGPGRRPAHPGRLPRLSGAQRGAGRQPGTARGRPPLAQGQPSLPRRSGDAGHAAGPHAGAGWPLPDQHLPSPGRDPGAIWRPACGLRPSPSTVQPCWKASSRPTTVGCWPCNGTRSASTSWTSGIGGCSARL